jgi:inner membrane protein
LDNVTHSLVGIALADVALGTKPSRADRRLAVGAGIIAGNLPDIDLAYSGIAAQPLGYLLHHRGHTHTIVGLIALAFLLILAYRRVPSVQNLRTGNRMRLWSLIAIALASHLLLDSLNSYGVHPFYPIDSSWYYGDALFIFEPWLWVVLGIAVAWSARSRTARLAAALPILIFPLTMVSMAIIPPLAAASLAIVGVPFAWFSLRQSPRLRAGLALTVCLFIIIGLLAVSRAARRAVEDAVRPELHGRSVDMILSPNPSSPWCWAAIAIELDEGRAEYVLRRGTLSLASRWADPTECASHRFTGAREVKRLGREGEFVLRDEIHQPLPQLRDLAQRDCWARAWLRFGRAPVISEGSIFDLRFAERLGQNFTRMPLAPGPRDCPLFLPVWGMPRADLINRRSGD